MSGKPDEHAYDVVELVRKAELDYLTVQRLELPLLAEVICFHCQQCAEKYLKALVSAHGEVPERTHDLLVLHARVDAYESAVEGLLPDLALLNPFAVAVRYAEGTADTDMAHQAIEAMERVRNAARDLLNLEDAREVER
ncbi:MAG: HEPN domain-containing protein [candidate division WS1 bacterium]|jgi:HEPN domain-containing protein|nr:HEPN domain-containing protein [candidate division WS1 bacterium]